MCIAFALGALPGAIAQLNFTVSSNAGFTLTCTNPTIILQATSNYTPAPSYIFFSPSAQQFTINPVSANLPGTWTVTATAGTATATQTLAVLINTLTPAVSLTTTGGASITCLSPTVQLSATASPSNTSFTWIEPGVGFGCTTSTCIAATSGIYGVNATDPANGCVGSSTVLVADGRSYPVFGTVGLFTVSCPGGTVDLTPAISTPTTGLGYQWQSPASAVTGSSNGPVLNTNAPGVYTFIVTHIASGCSSQTLVNVWACVGISETTSASQINIYPNPAENRLYIALNAAMALPVQVSITNALGQRVAVYNLGEVRGEIDLKGFNAGIYYLVLRNGSSAQIHKTFYVTRP